jgi:tetratricopeptide (TPR) repeat protein
MKMKAKGEGFMKTNSNPLRVALLMAASLVGGSLAFGQAPSSTPAPAQADKPNTAPPQQQAAPLTLESTPPPVSAEEDAAYKAFDSIPKDDPAKKEQSSIDFLQKYPESRYRAQVYNWQVKYYYGKGQVDKMEVAADKELAIAPTDAGTMAIVGSVLPRAINASTPDAVKLQRLAKSQEYSQKALDLLPTLTKPEGMTDEAFTKGKNAVSAMAYSGLGMTAFRQGKYADAIPHFEKAIQLDIQPDPVNYYVLGICNEKTSHFDAAVTDFTKCSDIPGGLQAACKSNIDEAKKLGATQLSAPK